MDPRSVTALSLIEDAGQRAGKESGAPPGEIPKLVRIECHQFSEDGFLDLSKTNGQYTIEYGFISGGKTWRIQYVANPAGGAPIVGVAQKPIPSPNPFPAAETVMTPNDASTANSSARP